MKLAKIIMAVGLALTVPAMAMAEHYHDPECGWDYESNKIGDVKEADLIGSWLIYGHSIDAKPEIITLFDDGSFCKDSPEYGEYNGIWHLKNNVIFYNFDNEPDNQHSRKLDFFCCIYNYIGKYLKLTYTDSIDENYFLNSSWLGKETRKYYPDDYEVNLKFLKSQYEIEVHTPAQTDAVTGEPFDFHKNYTRYRWTLTSDKFHSLNYYTSKENLYPDTELYNIIPINRNQFIANFCYNYSNVYQIIFTRVTEENK